MIPLAIPNLSGNEARYLQECIETNFVSSVGPFVTRFEAMVAEAAGAPYAVATSAGTTGLHAALTAVGVRRDDLVILQSMTFIASANCHRALRRRTVAARYQPGVVDARSGTTGERARGGKPTRRDGGVVHRATGRRVAAIMPVYTLGMPADMDPIMETARAYGLPVVADAAAALGARYKGRAIGALGADLTVFSFNGNKTVTAGGGGAVVGADEALCALRAPPHDDGALRRRVRPRHGGVQLPDDQPASGGRLRPVGAAGHLCGCQAPDCPRLQRGARRSFRGSVCFRPGVGSRGVLVRRRDAQRTAVVRGHTALARGGGRRASVLEAGPSAGTVRSGPEGAAARL